MEGEKYFPNEERKPPIPLRFQLLAVFLVAAVSGSAFGFMSGSLAGMAKLPGGWKTRLERVFGKKDASESERLRELHKETIVQEDSVIIDTVERSTPAVVSIAITKKISNSRNFFDPFGFFRAPDNTSDEQKVGGGSGFIVTDGGMIVTNRHVVEDRGATYKVTLSDGREFDARILAVDPVRDLAVIKIEAQNLPVLTLGDSDAVKIGQTVLAIGNSLGEFANTVSKGIISGLGRDLVAGSSMGETEQLSDIFQTDAPINPGNSGGPLLNVNGEVIGVNVAMAQGAQNVGFAIPINQVKKAIEQVKSQGKISVPFLGVRYAMIDSEIQSTNNLPFSYGAIVVRGQRTAELAVVPGSPADKAGIVENDIILEINGTKLDEKNPLSQVLSQYASGDEIELKVWHRGETKTVRVKLEERK